MEKKIVIFILSLFLASYAIAQETICNDGVDNDGDGFIDCFDGDCASDAACDGFYLGNDANCEAEPSAFPQFSLSLGYQSQNDASLNLSRIAIGDLDRDGLPEILSTNRYDDRIFLLNGDDATIKHQATTNNPSFRSAAIANLEDDNCGEVFMINENWNTNYTITAFDCELNELWQSERMNNDPVFVSLADFDRDGIPEMYYKDEIRDPITGTVIVDGNTGTWNDLPAGPVAVDILGDDDLELVLGNRIYAVNVGNRSANAGSLTLLATMPAPYQTKNGSYRSAQSSTTSVADYNLDGNLDVIITGATTGNVTSAFFWDVANNNVEIFNDPRGTGNYQFGWIRGMGRINIADLDGDGQLNAAFVSGRFLYALDENWDALWIDEIGDPAPTGVNEETSGITGCTLFDFNGDGQSEVVYRDEDNLYIINGNDGSVNTSIPCRSRTSVEYPIVADVDADGSTEICVVCASENFQPTTLGRNLSLSTPAEVRVYKSAGEPWVPARRLWNQHAYFNVNVNDDLTIPQNQQKHQLIFSNGICSAGPNRPLNSFLNQSPFLSSDGCPTYASPDLDIIESSLVVTPPTCPDEDFTVSFDFENIGDVALTGSVPVSFYDGDPLVAGTNRLNTVNIALSNFGVGQSQNTNSIIVQGSGSAFTLYVSFNDNGSTTPTPISFPSSQFLECDYTNNIISAEINPIPFNLTTESISDSTCVGGGGLSNGAAIVYRVDGTDTITADYDFLWFNGTSVGTIPDYIGSVYSGIPAGTYTVFAEDKTAGCSSDTVQVVVDEVPRILNATINVDNGNSNCDSPNGQLSVSINGGEPVGNFQYEWYEGNTVGGGLQISNSHIASGLEAGTYTVLVTEPSTGCTTISSFNVPDERVIPVVTASAVDILCTPASVGEVSADVGGSTANYTFEWYEGSAVKPSADFTGNVATGLAAGDYTVVATNDTTGCASAPVTMTINQTLEPEISNISSTPNNSCDPTLPNGTVTVAIVGDPAEHTIEWFAGGSATGLVQGTGLNVSNLGAGTYTVRVTNNSTSCFTTDQVTINNDIEQPVLTAVSDPVTACAPFNGRIEASVSIDNVSDYEFSWYIGDQVTASPDFSETGHILSNLEPGTYTVQAFNTSRNCLSDPITIDVADNVIINIVQNSTGIQLPNTCEVTDGILEVEASAPGNTSGFLIEWYEGGSVSGSPFFSETGVTTSTATGLQTGIYTVVATDLDNGCSRAEPFTLPFAGAHELNNVVTTDATTCMPNNEGSITFDLIPTTLAGFDESDYTLYLYEGNDNSSAAIDSISGVAGTTTYSFSGLSNGDYTIEALSGPTLGSCSVFALTSIDLTVDDPIISPISRIPNTNCETTFANGEIEIEIDGGADPNDYTINWFEGNDTSTPLGTNIGLTAGINGEIAENLIGDTYTVEVINNATQCATIRSYSISENPVIVSFPDISLTPKTRCDIDNGEATVPTILENGNPGNLADYTFEWYDVNMDILPNATTPNTTNTQANLAEGVYFVRAVNASTGCRTALIEFEIERDIIEPDITVSFTNPQRCVTPADGRLEVAAVAAGSTFTYNWYDGPDTSGPVAEPNSPSYSNLSAGEYTVEIIDDVTRCVYTETYRLVLEVNPLNLTASATPLTTCDSPNGSVFATVNVPPGGSYSYVWRDASGNIVGNDRQVNGLDAGEYTVTVTDDTDAFCEETATVIVEDERIFPDVQLMEIAPLSVCDLSRANGAATARVNGDFIGYTFEWFEGNTATGTAVHTGPDFSEMAAITYTVRVTDNRTQCTSEETITISSDIPEVPAPNVELVANDTHCEIDNGEVSVDVEGNTANYFFQWYLGESTSGTTAGTGERIRDLPAGNYTVTATDLRTGCISEPMTISVEEVLVFPEVTFEISPANCNQRNGVVQSLISGGAEIGRIEWFDEFGNFISSGPNLEGAAAGTYRLEIETNRGCVIEEEAIIPTEINEYNGISRNGDGANSFFYIECIESFPDNIVKIYNRAGTLVYEARGYDNTSTKFDGVSNRGINILGQNLPDGTYFYVIDKNDGSKPVNGYLEIVN